MQNLRLPTAGCHWEMCKRFSVVPFPRSWNIFLWKMQRSSSTTLWFHSSGAPLSSKVIANMSQSYPKNTSKLSRRSPPVRWLPWAPPDLRLPRHSLPISSVFLASGELSYDSSNSFLIFFTLPKIDNFEEKFGWSKILFLFKTSKSGCIEYKIQEIHLFASSNNSFVIPSHSPVMCLR